MTRIVLHPREVARWGPEGGQRVMLPAPWAWWETHLLDISGRGLRMDYTPDALSIEEFSATFGLDDDRVVLTDPPSMFLIHLEEYQDLWESGEPPTRIQLHRALTARVVWWGSPGEGWRLVEGARTCRPGLYQHDSHSRTRGIGGFDYEQQRRQDVFYEPMPDLDWPIHPMIIDGRVMDPPQWVPRSPAVLRVRRPPPAPDLDIGEDTPVPVRRHRPVGWDVDLVRTEITRQGMQTSYLQMDESRAYMRAAQDAYRRLGEGLISVAEFEAIRRQYRQDAQLRRSAIKPEADVVDEIDRLVNEQLRPGPRDDYSINRYPQCTVCGHQWHGLECESPCDCINTDWLNDDKAH